MSWILPFRPLGPYECPRPQRSDMVPEPTDWSKVIKTEDVPSLSGWKIFEDKEGGPVSFVYTLDVPGYDKSTVKVSLSAERDCLVIRTEPTQEKNCRNSFFVKVPLKLLDNQSKYNKIDSATLKAVCKNGQLKISGMFDTKQPEMLIPVTDE